MTRPRRFQEGVLYIGRERQGIGGRMKRDQEGVTLCGHFVAIVPLDAFSHDVIVNPLGIVHGFWCRLPKGSAALDVGRAKGREFTVTVWGATA